MIFIFLLWNLGKRLSRNTENSGHLIYRCFVLTSCNIVCGYGVDEELGSDSFLTNLMSWCSVDLTDNAAFFFLFALVKASLIPPSLHCFQLSQCWFTHTLLTFPKLPFPIARSISKWSKVTARNSKHSNAKWLSNRRMKLFLILHKRKKPEGCSNIFLLFLKTWGCLKFGV